VTPCRPRGLHASESATTRFARPTAARATRSGAGPGRGLQVRRLPPRTGRASAAAQLSGRAAAAWLPPPFPLPPGGGCWCGAAARASRPARCSLGVAAGCPPWGRVPPTCAASGRFILLARATWALGTPPRLRVPRSWGYVSGCRIRPLRALFFMGFARAIAPPVALRPPVPGGLAPRSDLKSSENRGTWACRATRVPRASRPPAPCAAKHAQ